MRRAVLGLAALLTMGASGAALAAAVQDGPGAADAFVAEPALFPADAAAVTANCDRYDAEIRRRQAALEAETGPGTVEGTFRRFDDLYLVTFSGLTEASLLMNVHVDAAVRDAAQACAGRLSDVVTDLGLSRPLYDRLKAVDPASADPEVRFLLERAIRDYALYGVDRDEPTRERLAALQRDISAAGLTFARNIADARLTVAAAPSALDGLPADYIAAHPPGEDGLVRISTDYPDLYPAMSYAHDADLRRRLFVANNTRAWPDNDAVLGQVAAARHAMATLLGHADFASLDLANKMVSTPAQARAFIDGISRAADAAARRDLALMIERLRRDDPTVDAVAPWSSGYVIQTLMKEAYEVDPQEVRRYFAYDNVRDGVIQLTEDLFGVDIRPWDTPVWAPGVEAYEMYDGDRLIGRFYLDNHPREGKFSHAAVFPIRTGLAGRATPVATLVCNFPAGDHSTGLMEHGDVETFLHEFGHLIHMLFAGGQAWTLQNPFLGLESDFTEAPSTMLENWVWDYDTLSRFAVNAEGETIPRDLVERMVRARSFAEAYGDRRQLGFSAVSLDLYTGAPVEDRTALFLASYDRYSLSPMSGADVHPQASFGHLTRYGAAYYTYMWSKAISSDLFTAFEAAGLRDPETARRYRDLVLAPGGSKPAARLIEDFLGRPMSLDAYRERLSR